MARAAKNSYLPLVAGRELETLAQALARLPGLGPRSARRAVLYLVKKRESALEPLLAALQAVAENLVTCSTCGNVDTVDPCALCSDPRRDTRLLCVVEEVADLWALDRSRLFPGHFMSLAGVFQRWRAFVPRISGSTRSSAASPPVGSTRSSWR